MSRIVRDFLNLLDDGGGVWVRRPFKLNDLPNHVFDLRNTKRTKVRHRKEGSPCAHTHLNVELFSESEIVRHAIESFQRPNLGDHVPVVRSHVGNRENTDG
jgi:hypothetical protein